MWLLLLELVFDADDNFPLTRALREGGAQPARFYCAERIIASAAEKTKLRQTTGADAVDMESVAIRLHCRDRGIPSATLRIISDAADESMPLDFNRFLTPRSTIDYARLAVTLLKGPARIGPLLAFRRHTQAAAKALAFFLQTILAKDI